jgi:hypothetical protein
MGRSAYSPPAAPAVRWGMNAEREVDVLSWFSEDELKNCPHCEAHAAVPVDRGPSVCLACEVVWLDELDPSQR